MITPRAKKSVIEKIAEQFRMYGLTVDVSYDEYVKTVDSPVTKRTISSGWRGRWVCLMAQVAKACPDLLEKKIPTAEEKLAKLRALSTSKVGEQIA